MPISAAAPRTARGEFYHVRIKPRALGRYALLPGDPDRVDLITRFLDEVRQVSTHREFRVATGYVRNARVTVCSTGIGAPAAAIAMEELARAGVHTFIRVGTCGAIQRAIQLGDLVVATAGVRLEGTSRQYVRLEYPAVASRAVVAALSEAGARLGLAVHEGIVASTDSFYVGQSRPGLDGFLSPEAKGLLDEMRLARVLCFEMEASALFTVANLYGLRAGAVLAVVANRLTDVFAVRGVEAAARTAVEAVERLVRTASGRSKSAERPSAGRRHRADSPESRGHRGAP